MRARRIYLTNGILHAALTQNMNMSDSGTVIQYVERP